MQQEFTACEIRKVLQQLFPHRQLVLSQFTFYNQIGVAKPSGSSFRRGRRCYAAGDIVPIATVLALKEEGIPLKSIGDAPLRIQQHIAKIYYQNRQTNLMGFGNTISLSIEGESNDTTALDAFLSDPTRRLLFWNFDVSALAQQIRSIVNGEVREQFRIFAA